MVDLPQFGSSDLCTSVQCFWISIGTVINDHGQVSASEEEGEDYVGSNVTQSTGDEDGLYLAGSLGDSCRETHLWRFRGSGHRMLKSCRFF